MFGLRSLPHQLFKHLVKNCRLFFLYMDSNVQKKMKERKKKEKKDRKIELNVKGIQDCPVLLFLYKVTCLQLLTSFTTFMLEYVIKTIKCLHLAISGNIYLF